MFCPFCDYEFMVEHAVPNGPDDFDMHLKCQRCDRVSDPHDCSLDDDE